MYTVYRVWIYKIRWVTMFHLFFRQVSHIGWIVPIPISESPKTAVEPPRPRRVSRRLWTFGTSGFQRDRLHDFTMHQRWCLRYGNMMQYGCVWKIPMPSKYPFNMENMWGTGRGERAREREIYIYTYGKPIYKSIYLNIYIYTYMYI
jgi:hypothetical protein